MYLHNYYTSILKLEYSAPPSEILGGHRPPDPLFLLVRCLYSGADLKGEDGGWGGGKLKLFLLEGLDITLRPGVKTTWSRKNLPLNNNTRHRFWTRIHIEEVTLPFFFLQMKKGRPRTASRLPLQRSKCHEVHVLQLLITHRFPLYIHPQKWDVRI